METTVLEREFRYNAVKLPDPSPAMTLTQVRDFFANVYPEIISADIDGPEMVGSKSIYTFRRAVGTKGQRSLDAMIKDLANLLHVNYLQQADADFVKEVQQLVGANESARISGEAQQRLASLHCAHCQAQEP